MKILFVLKQKKNVETFADTIRALIDRGHSVALAVQEHTDSRADQYRDALDSPRRIEIPLRHLEHGLPRYRLHLPLVVLEV